MRQNFAMLGDQFLIAYSRLDAHTTPVTLFTIGHALELYLKALILFHNPNEDIAKNYGHNITKMIKYINSQTGGLLDQYVIEENKFEQYTECPLPISVMQEKNYYEYIENQELYWIVQHLSDLKYLGTYHKTIPTSFAICIYPCNLYWANFFIKIRKYLDWQKEGIGINYIKLAIESGCINQNQHLFLNSILYNL